MEITDIRIKLVNRSNDRLKAFCSITLDEEFVIRDIKLVEGANGLFVAMPSRKLTGPCQECKHKNPLRARYCGECGAGLPNVELPVDDVGRLRLYRDIAHPITQVFREKLQADLIEAYQAENGRTDETDYQPDSEGVLDEFEDADMSQQPEASEYDSLIAGLDHGKQETDSHRTSDRGARERSCEPKSSEDSQRRRQRGGRGGRGRRTRDDRESVTKPRSVPVGQVVSERDGGPEKPLFDVAEKTHEAERSTGDTQSDRDDRSDRVALGDVAEKAPAVESLEDSNTFGAGIL